MKSSTKAILIVAVIVAFQLGVYGLFSGSSESDTATEVIEDPKERAIAERVAVATMMLYKIANDPDSIVIERVTHTSFHGMVCIVFRAKNGFGGYVQNGIVIQPETGIIETDLAVWNDNCIYEESTDRTSGGEFAMKRLQEIGGI